MKIPWKEIYVIGVKEIDDQHRHFVEILNKLFDVIYIPEKEDDLEGIINELKEYALNHFKTEEKYFDLFHYEFSQEHKKEHERLTQKIIEFEKEFPKNKVENAVELFYFMQNWLIDHLDAQDKKYVECFKKNGLK